MPVFKPVNRREAELPNNSTGSIFNQQILRVMVSLINNATVRNGNADYWARLGAILKENKENGISNEIYADLALPINNGAFFKRMIAPTERYFNLTDND